MVIFFDIFPAGGGAALEAIATLMKMSIDPLF